MAPFAGPAEAASAPCETVEIEVYGVGKCSPIYFTTVDCWKYTHEGAGPYAAVQACYPTQP